MPPRLARLLAVLAALVLVAVAFLVRGLLGGDDDTTTTGAGGPDATLDGGAPFRVLCDDDLGRACEVLAAQPEVASVEVVRAADAVSALTGDDPAYDVWLTLDPWPQMLASASDPDRPVTVTDPLAVASAPLAVLVDPDVSPCTDPTDWECLTTPANPPVGIASPTTATGSLVLAHAAAGLQGTTDFGINQLSEEVRIALEDLLDAVGSERGRPVAEQADGLLQPGRFSAVVAPDGRAEMVAGSAQGTGRGLAVDALEPDATIGVVVVGVGPRGTAALDALRDAVTDQTVRQALAGEGWTGPPRPSSGLPAPDVIYALQEELT